jgi:hypothetical protein
MSATCHVGKQRHGCGAVPDRKPLGVMPSPTIEDITIVAAVRRHRHESCVPRCRGATGRTVHSRKPLERGLERHPPLVLKVAVDASELQH